MFVACISVVTLTLTTAAGSSSSEGQLQTRLLKIFRDEFVPIKPGTGRFPATFTMGGPEISARPEHQVTIDYEFAIARFEVPQNLWEAVMGSNPSKWKGPRNSVEMINLAAAKAFCAKATGQMRKANLISEQEVVRLPSEAEWEYCTRAGTESAYSFGDSPEKLGDYAWFTGNAAGNDPPVGAKKPNPWKLYDTHGYLWEWCLDDWSNDYTAAPGDGSARVHKPPAADGVVRGGSWKDKAGLLTSSYRLRVPKTKEDDSIGLRCVLANTRTTKP